MSCDDKTSEQAPELEQAESWLKGAVDWERDEGGKYGNDAIVISGELDRLRAEVARLDRENAALRAKPRPSSGPGSRDDLLAKIHSYAEEWKTGNSPAHSPAKIALYIALDNYDFRGQLASQPTETKVAEVFRECFAESSRPTENLAGPVEKLSEDTETSVPDVGGLLSGDPGFENAFTLVPVKVMGSIVTKMEQLVSTCSAQWETLNDIADRIPSHVDVSSASEHEALRYISELITLWRKVQRECTGSKEEKKNWTVWVRAKEFDDAYDTFQNGYDYSDREICRGAAQITEEILYRVDITVTKEPDVKTGEPGPGSPAGGSS